MRFLGTNAKKAASTAQHVEFKAQGSKTINHTKLHVVLPRCHHM